MMKSRGFALSVFQEQIMGGVRSYHGIISLGIILPVMLIIVHLQSSCEY